MLRAYSRCDLLLLEFNHELEMLRRGPYPAALKRRVSGDFGHLNNQQALAMLNSLGDDLPQVVIAGHISEQNNAIDVVESLLEPMISSTDLTVIYATQSQGFDWVSPKSDDDISRVA